jgi:Na+/proline symporter
MVTPASDAPTQGKPILWFAGLMYLVAVLVALVLDLVVLVLPLTLDWFNPHLIFPYAPFAVVVLWTLGALAFGVAALLTLHWARVAAALALTAWVAGLLSPLLTPMWQQEHDASVLLRFGATWLLVLLPLGVGVAYGVVLRPRAW